MQSETVWMYMCVHTEPAAFPPALFQALGFGGTSAVYWPTAHGRVQTITVSVSPLKAFPEKEQSRFQCVHNGPACHHVTLVQSCIV